MRHCVKPPVFLAVPCAALAVIVGCGGSSSSPPASPFPSLNGNYQLRATSTVNGTSTLIGGQVTESSGTVTGMVHVAGTRCFNFLSDVAVSGTVTKDGALEVKSSSVAQQVITINATVSEDGSTISTGTYTIAGGCADKDKGSVSGFRVPTINGTYAGTFATTGGQIKTSVQISQTTAADANGFFHLSGSGTFNSSCFTKASIATPSKDSEVLGTTVVVDLTTNEAGAKSIIVATGTLDATGKTFTGTYVVAGGSCNGDSGSGTLTLQ